MFDGSFLQCLVKVGLLAFNTLLAGLGSGVLALGVGLRLAKSDTLQMAFGISGLGSNAQGHLSAAASIDSLVSSVSIVFCAIGGVGLLIGGLGFIGALCGKAGLLRFYAFLLCLVVFLHIALVLVVYLLRETVTDLIGNELFELQNKFYLPTQSESKNSSGRNDSSEAGATHIINGIQVWFECCGIKRHGDGARSRSWNKSDQTWQGRQLTRPATCCKLVNSQAKTRVMRRKFNLLDELKENLMVPECPFLTGDATSMVHNVTCPKAIENYLSKYSIPGLVFAGILIGLQVAGILLACYLIKLADDEEEDDYYDDW